jgi:hypothetical protein
MEDDFDLKPRLRKLAMIAAGVVALVVLAVVLLTTGSHSGASTVSAKSTGSSKWEYTTVLARCSYDKSTGKMICNRMPKGDSTDINGVLTEMSKSGWDLVGVSSGNDKGGPMSAFVFKKPK